jgi:carbon starvation protein
MKQLMPYWYNFALMFEALFILTTVDTGTRVARFLVQELGGHVYKPLAQQRWVPGILVTSLLVVVAWGYLIWSGSVSTIWPMFGVSNQLLAAIALGVGTTIIIKYRRTRYIWVTLVPMVFMYATTLTAAWSLTITFWTKAAAATSTTDALNYRLDAVLVVVMGVLAVVTLCDMVYKWTGYLSGSREIVLHEVTEYEAAKA